MEKFENCMFSYFRYLFLTIRIDFKYLRKFQNILIFWIFFWILNLKVTIIFKYINLIRIHSNIQNILVRFWFGFGYGFLDTKILNSFGYLTVSVWVRYYFFG